MRSGSSASCPETHEAPHRADFGHGVSARFRHSSLTTLPTQVPLVSIGCRGSTASPWRARRLGALFAGFPPRRVPLTDAGCVPLVPLLKYGSDEQHSSSLKGALLEDYRRGAYTSRLHGERTK